MFSSKKYNSCQCCYGSIPEACDSYTWLQTTAKGNKYGDSRKFGCRHVSFTDVNTEDKTCNEMVDPRGTQLTDSPLLKTHW